MTETNPNESASTFLTIADIAERIGVGETSLRTYHQRAAANRRAGMIKQGDLPEPARYFGRSPVWSVEQIERWIAARPGRGRSAG